MNNRLGTNTRSRLVTLLVALSVVAHSAASAEPSADQIEFFEARIRPVLVEHCYECHNSIDAAEGEFVADHRDGMLGGGAGGKVIVPGDAAGSRLIAILKHEVDGLEMPDGGPKLDEDVIADFERWIRDGAADPRDDPPSAEELGEATAWEAVLERRKQWWSFLPIRPTQAPGDPSGHPIDRFIDDRLSSEGIPAVSRAQPEVLVRRAFFNLTGLPPTVDEARSWTQRLREAPGDGHAAVFAELVDDLLGRSEFGERWARHWMDWIRYAESHGSEGDPEIVGAWHYRDYLIRALNEDIPIDQLIREHVAGDLLTEPRINHELGINESAIGPAHWRMVFHGFAPTDALDERVRFTDDQINAFSKAFLGLTVSCARCHDHKFDAISQKDYYALFGVLASCRPGRTVVTLASQLEDPRNELLKLKTQLRRALADDWLRHADTLADRIRDGQESWDGADRPNHLMHLVHRVRKQLGEGADFDTVWKRLAETPHRSSGETDESLMAWSPGDAAQHPSWYRSGSGLGQTPDAAGTFAVEPEGDRAIQGIFPAGVYSHAVSTKLPARLASEDFDLTEEAQLWCLVAGDSQASLRYVVQDYPRSGTVFPVKKLSPEWKWERFDLDYWNGERVHIELAGAMDGPLLVNNQPRSWFGIRQAKLIPSGSPAPKRDNDEFLAPIRKLAETNPPHNQDELAELYRDAIAEAVQVWVDETISDAQAVMLGAAVAQGLLPNELDALPTAAPLIERYRAVESEIPIALRVPGLDETRGVDQALFERGNHKLPGEPVPRRFLEAIDATPYASRLSGRLELAEDLLRDDNPLTRRVMVNRVWHHLFGQGLVRTPDNFGRLGDTPSHPELLDWLASKLADGGWSLKQLIRSMVLTDTWQRSSRASEPALAQDPDNRLLSHANVRRMEAEAVRDSLLAVSGMLDRRTGGPPVDGRSNRRSVYVRVRRNSLDPLLRVFDFPEPFSSVGRRDVTNVPAQSLAMMNDETVARFAEAWARRVQSEVPNRDPRIAQMFWTALGRAATEQDIQRAASYVNEASTLHGRRTTMRDQWLDRIKAARTQIRLVKDPVRTRLLETVRPDSSSRRKEAIPPPIARWDFEGSLEDALGNAHGQSFGDARVEGGALVTGNGGYVITQPVKQRIRAKTLEAWVQLDNMNQRGGGAITIQTSNGGVFDSIVFAERQSKRWMAGSNSFARTQDFGGTDETEADSRPVHLAIVYHENGRITGYRDGRPYGKPYQSSGPQTFKPKDTVIAFGVRHSPPGGNRLLACRIFEARLYDRALTPEEVALSSDNPAALVSEADVIAAMTPQQRQTVVRAEQTIAEAESQLDALGQVPDVGASTFGWQELARAMFALKEFIYVR